MKKISNINKPQDLKKIGNDMELSILNIDSVSIKRSSSSDIGF